MISKTRNEDYSHTLSRRALSSPCSEEDDAGPGADRIVELFLSKDNVQNALRTEISGTSKEKHFSRLLVRGSSYMSAALAPGLDIEDRIAAVRAGLQFLEHERFGSRARVNGM